MDTNQHHRFSAASSRAKHLFRAVGLGLTTLIIAGSAAAQDLPPGVIEQGNGWQRVLESGEDDTLSTTSTASAPDREVIVLSSADGLEAAPLPDAIKDMLRPDFGGSGASVATFDNGEAVVVDLAVAQAIADGTAETLYADYLEPDDPGEVSGLGWGCHTNWRYREWDALSVDFDQPNIMNRSGRVSLHSGLRIDGEASAYIGYKYKKTRFCLPWVAWFTHVRVEGFANFDGSNLNVNATAGSTELRERWRREVGRLFDLNTTFFVGPVPVRIGVQMPFGLGVDAALVASFGLQFDLPMNGGFWFNYTCDFDGCRETPGSGGSGSEFDIGNGGNIDIGRLGTGVGAGAEVQIRPFAYIELIGYLYHPEIASAGFGLEAGLPVKIGAWRGNCGDGDANGQMERADTDYVDLNAELALYFTYNLAGLSRHFGLDFELGVDLFGAWRIYTLTDDDDMFRGTSPLVVLRKNLWFWYDINLEQTVANIFSPVVVGSHTPYAGYPTDYILTRRFCNPFKDAVTYRVTMPDGTTTDISEGTNPTTGLYSSPAVFSASFETIEPRSLEFRILRDSAGREFDTSDWSNEVNYLIDPVADVSPPVPDFVSVPSQRDFCSGCILNVGWAEAPLTDHYEVQKQENGGSWRALSTATNRVVQYSMERVGNFKFRVRACNDHGCSGYRESSSVQIGNPPSTPSLSIRSEYCYGMNDVSWGSVSAATRYKLWRSGTSSWTNVTKVYEGTGRSYFSNASNPLWYRVQACNAVGCSSLSSARRASVHSGCF